MPVISNLPAAAAGARPNVPWWLKCAPLSVPKENVRLAFSFVVDARLVMAIATSVSVAAKGGVTDPDRPYAKAKRRLGPRGRRARRSERCQIERAVFLAAQLELDAVGA